jgi:hypothetical protein
MKNCVAIYPKTYATIQSITYHCYRDNFNYQDTKIFSKEEYDSYRTNRYWRQKLAKRWLCRKVVMVVKTDSGELRELDACAYNGHRFGLVNIGRRIKIYHRPQDRRGYCYSLTGD